MKGFKVVGPPGPAWYGPGYCGICGDRRNIVPVAVRWWDPDDGWRMGVLCPGCTAEAEDSPGPQPGDWALRGRDTEELDEDGKLIDIGVEYGDEDSAYSDTMQ